AFECVRDPGGTDALRLNVPACSASSWSPSPVGSKAAASQSAIGYEDPRLQYDGTVGRFQQLEWIPSRLRCELKIAEVGAKPQSHTGTDRNHHHFIRRKNCHAETANEIR